MISHLSTPNPYVGPLPLAERDGIFGRDREVRDLLHLLIAERVVLFYSPSGAGKTSLIQAGLIPALRRERFRVHPVLRVVHADADKQAAAVANRYIHSILNHLEDGRQARSRTRKADLRTETLESYLRRFSAHRQSGNQAPIDEVLIFDQFEEILTTDPIDETGRLQFFKLVGEQLLDRRRWALFSIREDYLAALDPYRHLIPTRFNTRLRLDLLGRDAALVAIQRPARREKVTFSKRAATELVDDLRRVRIQKLSGQVEEVWGPHVEPLQLQVVCRQLWQRVVSASDGKVRRIEQAHLDLLMSKPAADDDGTRVNVDITSEPGQLSPSTDYVGSALSEYYSEAVTSVTAKTGVRERVIRDWFDRLITDQGIRGQVLLGSNESQGLVNEAVQLLISAHLVRGEYRRGATWYELAHDRLVEPVRWSNRAWRRRYFSPLQVQAELWQAQGRPNSLLLRGADLIAAERWALEHRAEMLAFEHQFMSACQDERGVEHGMLAQRLAARTLSLQRESASDELVALLARQAYSFHERSKRGDLDQIYDALRAALGRPFFTVFLRGHDGAVLSVAMRPGHVEMASAGEDGTVRIWDPMQPGRPSIILQKFERDVVALAYSGSGRYLASGDGGRRIYLWDRTQMAPPRVLTGRGSRINTVALSTDDRWLASGHRTGTVRLWDLHQVEPEPYEMHGHGDGVKALAFSADGTILASAGRDAVVRLWFYSPQDGWESASKELSGHSGWVNAVAINSMGDVLASAGQDKVVRRWDLADLDQSSQPLQTHESGVNALAFTPDGEILASGGGDMVRLWNLQQHSPHPSELHGNAAGSNALAVSADGRLLASAGSDGDIRLWHRSETETTVLVLSQHRQSVATLAFHPDGLRLASGGLDGCVLIWDLSRPGAPPMTVSAYEGQVTSVTFSADGRTLASNSASDTIQLWSVEAADSVPMILSAPDLGPDMFSSERVSDAPSLATGAVAWSFDGRLIATAHQNGAVLLWGTGRSVTPRRKIHDGAPFINDLAFSRDGTRLVAGGDDGTVLLWNVVIGGDPTIVGMHGGGINALVLSPNGSLIASAGRDGTVRLWSPDGTQVERILRAQDVSVNAVAFNPDGSLLAFGGDDGSVRVWDLARPASPPDLLLKQTHPVTSLVYSPDGQTLAVGGHDGAIRLRPAALPLAATVRELADRICPRVTQNLSLIEWHDFVGAGVPYERTCGILPSGAQAPSDAPVACP